MVFLTLYFKFMRLLQEFGQEIKRFSKANWWVYLVYIFLLVLTGIINEEDLIQVIVITSLHFVADVLIMMMFKAYTKEDFAKGTYFQILSTLIFLSIKIYTGLMEGQWVYIIADPIYLLAAYKNYQKDVNDKDVKIINSLTMTALSIIIFGLAVLLRYTFNIEELSKMSWIDWNLLVGLFLFAIALSVTKNEKRRYFFSVLALSIMVMGALIKTINSFFIDEQIHGLEISYAILPMTVLFYNLKLWNSIMRDF